MKRKVNRAELEAQISTIEKAGELLSGFVQAMIIIILIALGTMWLQGCRSTRNGCQYVHDHFSGYK